MRYTKYIHQCLEELDDAAEYETDRLAVQLVRIQHLTNRIVHFHSRDQMVDELPGMPEVSATFCLEAFQLELDRLRNELPPNLKSDGEMAPLSKQVAEPLLMWCARIDSLCLHYNSAYLRLFEPLLEGSHFPDAESQSIASLSLSGLSIFDVFLSFTSALKTWFDDWLAIPVCSFFYIPQPASAQFIHASMMLARWARVAGPSAVRLSSAGTTAPRKEESTPSQTVPAFSGVPECPDLSLPQPSASPFNSTISAQTLSALRAHVLTQPGLQIDIFGIVDAMVIRFEAAKKEMAAAKGGVWENDTWDLAAEHIRRKKLRLEKWCEIVAIVVEKERIRLTDASNGVDEESGGTMNMLGGRSFDCFDWLVSSNDQENTHWESDLFDEIMRDIHTGGLLGTPGDWGTGVLDDMG